MKNKYNLPDYCFANDVLDSEKIIIIMYEKEGYYKTECRGDAMYYNKKIGVPNYVMRAMVCGSMFGWDVPGANPEKQKELYKRKNLL